MNLTPPSDRSRRDTTSLTHAPIIPPTMDTISHLASSQVNKLSINSYLLRFVSF